MNISQTTVKTLFFVQVPPIIGCDLVCIGIKLKKLWSSVVSIPQAFFLRDLMFRQNAFHFFGLVSELTHGKIIHFGKSSVPPEY
mmetsp:Transcript_42173/g.49275  ORF Transcript_42173/g.49275 Transcript_42173/m.49275 type:complete len:84 (-) Transcript_42173:324-575(-)